MLWRGPMGGGAASGKIGAMIAGHCAQGQYLKSRVGVTNPRSTFQHGTRNALRQLAVQWGELLTSTQRAAWNTYAANVTWTNRLGDTVHLSGQMEFCRSNLTLQLAGLPFVLDAPTTFDRGDVGGAPTLTLAPGGAFFTLTLNPSSPWLSGNVLDGLMVYLSLPRSGGITFFKRRTRFNDRIPGTAAGSVHLFGFDPWPLPSLGQAWQVWVAAQFADGRLTTPVPTNIVFTPQPLRLRWFDDFQYPDGDLVGNDDWILFNLTSLLVDSDTVTADPGDALDAQNTTPAAMPDASVDFEISVFASFNQGDPADPDTALVMTLDNGSEQLYLLLQTNNVHALLDQLDTTFLQINDTGGTTTTNVPCGANIVHKFTIAVSNGVATFRLDDAEIATTTGTALAGAMNPTLLITSAGGSIIWTVHRIETRY